MRPRPFRLPRVVPSAFRARLFCALLALLLHPFLPATARAHGPQESTLTLTLTPESLELVASLSLPVAATLLPAHPTPPFSASTFADHRDALATAAPRILVLLDATGQPLPPTAVRVSLHDAHDIRFHFFYPATTTPSLLRTPFLADLPPGYFIELTDARASPPRRHLLRPARATYSLAPLAPSSTALPRP